MKRAQIKLEAPGEHFADLTDKFNAMFNDFCYRIVTDDDIADLYGEYLAAGDVARARELRRDGVPMLCESDSGSD